MTDAFKKTCTNCNSDLDVNGVCSDCGYDSSIEQGAVEYLPQFAITADLKRENANFSFILGKLWKLTDNDILEFIAKVDEKFKRHKKNHSYIYKSITNTSVAVNLSKYSKKELEFESLVSTIMEKLCSEANADRRSKKGGSIIFIHYNIESEEDSLGRLFILMVDNNNGFNFDDDLIPKMFSTINLDSLRQAAMIDLTLFDATYPDNKGEPYLQFITGKSTSNFFKRALGCNETLDSTLSIDEVKCAVIDFLKHFNVKKRDKDNVQEAISKLLENTLKRKADRKLSIENFQNIIDSTLDDETIKGKFSDFVASRDYKINEFFEPTPSSKKIFETITLEDAEKDYCCQISYSALGINNKENKKITYNQTDGTLTIKLNENDIKNLNDYFGVSKNE